LEELFAGEIIAILKGEAMERLDFSAKGLPLSSL